MSSLSWDSLVVVAVDSLVGDTGAAVRLPFVRAKDDGRLFVVRDIESETVVPDLLLDEEEVRRRVEGGAWLSVPRLPAKRRHVVLVRSKAFADACKKAEHSSGFLWRPVAGGFELDYVPLDSSTEWRARCTRDLLAWSMRKLRRYLEGSIALEELKSVDEVLMQALYVCDRNTPERRELDCLFGVLLGEMAPERWPAAARIAVLQTPDLDAESLNRDVAALRADLLWSEDVPADALPDKPPRLWGEAA